MDIDISKFQFEKFVSTPDGVTFYFTGLKEFLPNPIIEADSAEIDIRFWRSLPNVYTTQIMIGLIFVQIVWMLKKFKVF